MVKQAAEWRRVDVGTLGYVNGTIDCEGACGERVRPAVSRLVKLVLAKVARLYELSAA